MSLLGKAFLIMWHDIVVEGQREYLRWHTRQHMPERVSHSGFIRSRRGVNMALDRQCYFTLYEGEDLGSFTAEDYMRSLNGPTEWTKRMAPHFRNFLRMTCSVAVTSGPGIGGALATFRSPLPPGQSEITTLEKLAPQLDVIAECNSVTGVHVGLARPEYAGGRTRETELRPQMQEPPFQIVVVVEGLGVAELTADIDTIHRSLTKSGMSSMVIQTYDIDYILERPRS